MVARMRCASQALWRNHMSRFTGTVVVRVAMFAALICALAGAASADIYMVQVHHTPELQMMGQTQPARTDTGSVWVTSDKVASLTGDNTSIIVRADLGKMYMIDHGAKKYTELPVNFNDMVDSMMAEAAEDSDDAQLAQAKEMMKQMMGEVKMTVTPTDSTQKIRDWDTRKYVAEITMSMGTTVSDMWVTKDVDINYEALWSATNAMLAILPGFDDMIAKMKTIEGMPVKTITTTTMMGQKMTSTFEVIEISTKDAPAGIYEVPEGYTKESFGKSMPGMGE